MCVDDGWNYGEKCYKNVVDGCCFYGYIEDRDMEVLMKNIVIGSDHAGVELKAYFKDFLQSNGYTVVDVGTMDATSCDYPDIAGALARHIGANPNCTGILICGTGVGMSIAVNRYSHIRGALLYNAEVAKLAREHNDANVAIFGARMFGQAENLELLKEFLGTDFSNDERHVRRIAKINSVSLCK